MEEELDKHPRRTLAFCLAAGVSIFVLGLFVLLTVVSFYGVVKPDPSALKFYPVMAGVGALFGFNVWWGYEQGTYNPHDR